MAADTIHARFLENNIVYLYLMSPYVADSNDMLHAQIIS